MFLQAAAANRSIFYDGVGRPRRVSDVYAKLTGRFDVARANSFAPDLTGKTRTAGPTPPSATRRLYAEGKPPLPPKSLLSPDTASVTQA